MLGVKLIKHCIHASIELTADDWQFYSKVKGRERAAKHLNRKIEKCLKQGNLSELTSLLYEYSKFGAADSEGYDTLARILTNLGIDRERYYL